MIERSSHRPGVLTRSPLLVNGCKVDMRVYVLVASDGRVFLYENGGVRVGQRPWKIDSLDQAVPGSSGGRPQCSLTHCCDWPRALGLVCVAVQDAQITNVARGATAFATCEWPATMAVSWPEVRTRLCASIKQARAAGGRHCVQPHAYSARALPNRSSPSRCRVWSAGERTSSAPTSCLTRTFRQARSCAAGPCAHARAFAPSAALGRLAEPTPVCSAIPARVEP